MQDEAAQQPTPAKTADITAESLLTGFPLDLSFLHRVYRTAGLLLAIIALLSWERFGSTAALGWLVGGAMSLMMLWGVEMAVLRVLNPGNKNASGLLLASVLKIFVAAAVLFFCLVGAMRGWISLWWVLGGFAMPHAVVMLKLIGQFVRRATATPPPPTK